MKNYDIDRARSYFDLDKGLTYLNNAAHSPMPNPVRKAYEEYFDSWQKTAHNHDAESFRIFEELRAKLAGMISAHPERIGFSPNTTFGLNILASGLRWQNGDNIVISQKEFPAGVYPWLRLKAKGVELRFAKTNGDFIDEDSLIAATDKRTRLIQTSWVQFNNGYRVDIDKLGNFCSENNILLSVDGMQGMGVIPIDVPSLKVDLFTSGCQKWMLGPCGTGFYYLSERAEALIDPPLSGWISVDWKAEFTNLMRYDLEPRKGPAKYEIGTYAFQDLRALKQAVDILLSFDSQARWEHIKSLTDRLISFLQSDKRYQLRSSTEDCRRSAIVTFKRQDVGGLHPDAYSTKALYDYLISNGFIVSFREGAVRVSPHFYNSLDEIERFIEAVKNFR